jgi:hypothetical protein
MGMLKSDKNEIALDVWIVGGILSHGWTSAMCFVVALGCAVSVWWFREKGE